MSRHYNNSTFRDLLDKLQQESWQLELLISGFAIFGLFTATDSLQTYYEAARYHQRLTETLVWFAANVCCWILIANLLIHVVLRGLWIGALGLRYVSGDIDYEELRYSPKFTNYLKRKIGSFDKYIATLEDYCSILFALSFLFVFYFLASFAFVVLLLIIVFLFLDNDFNGGMEKFMQITGIVLILFTIFGASLTFIDFITQGFLKRKKWISKLYFPIYWLYSYLTLSFLYRPLVYNFLDNKFGKRLSFVLIPIYLSILISSTMYYRDSNYLAQDQDSGTHYANSGNYEDMLLTENDFVKRATIPSKVITDNHLKVFIIFSENIENRIFLHNPGLKPKNDLRGFNSYIINDGDEWRNFRKKDSLKKEYYKTFNKVHKVFIDNKQYASDFIAGTNKKDELGFETFLNINDLEEGKHLLKISRLGIRKKDTIDITLVTIPFWKFNND